MSVEGFEPAWLRAREAADHGARAEELSMRLAEWWRERDGVEIVDLGAGTGSNLRYLAPRLEGRQRWTLIDRDPRLLEMAPASDGALVVRTVRGELDGPGLEAIRDATLATASALLDLASEDWVEALAERCADAGCAALLALTYDGRIEWLEGGDDDDGLVRGAVNRHQRRAKGLGSGSALGPTAGDFARRAFERRGYRTWCSDAPWILGASDADLARALLRGWVEAAVSETPSAGARIRAWADRREEAIDAGRFRLLVGHVDLLALPDTDHGGGAEA